VANFGQSLITNNGWLKDFLWSQAAQAVNYTDLLYQFMFYFPSITYLMEQQVEHLQEVCGAVAYPSRLDEVGEVALRSLVITPCSKSD
jgi:hypothetical protein